MKAEEWTLIYSTEHQYQAELIKQMFDSEAIESVIINKRDSSYNAFGEVEVHVKSEDREKALILIKNFES